MSVWANVPGIIAPAAVDSDPVEPEALAEYLPSIAVQVAVWWDTICGTLNVPSVKCRIPELHVGLRLFLSAVSDDYKPLRIRFGHQLRTGGFTVILQDEFPETGVNTPVKLAEFIEHESDIVLHLVGPKVGSVPGKEEVEVLLQHCGKERLLQRFPGLFKDDAYRRVTYTQWEAWLGLFYGKRVLIFEATDSVVAVDEKAADPTNGKPVPMSVGEHIELVKRLCGWATTFTDESSLINAAQTSLARILNLGTHHQSRPFHLPYSTLGELFIGRDGFLSDLREKFLIARKAGRWPNQAVCGVGGLGKTQVAIEYALRHLDDYSAVLMVNADTPESLRSSLAGLAGVLHSDLDPATPDNLKEQSTLQWLQQHPGWLLIVDNADTEAARDEVTRRLAQWANGHVLITARYKQWPNTVEALDLHVLSVDDAAKFLLQATDGKRIPASDDPQQARLLASDELDGLCLALEQAAAYIEERQITFAEYRSRWAENQKEARTWANSVKMQYHPEIKESLSVATTWLTTFQHLTPAAQSLLQMLAWLSPEPIPRSLIQHPEMELQWQQLCRVGPAAIRRAGPPSDDVHSNGGPALGASLSHPTTNAPTEDIETALAALRRYSLLSHRSGDPTDSAGRVHRVVQLITRERLPAQEQRTTLTAMLNVLNKNAPGKPADVRTWPTWEPLRPHVAFAVQEGKRLQILVPTSRLMNDLAVLLWAKALHSEAESLERDALAIDEKHFGPDATEVAVRLNNLAATLQATDRLAEAEPMMRRALAIDEQSFGAEHPKVAIRLNNLAQLLQATNRLAEAEPLMRRALAIDEQSYGAEHPRVAIDLNNLATLLQATNRLSEAEPLMRRALAIDEQSYGAEHPDVARDLNNLALLLKDTNRLADAEPLAQRAVEILQKSLGDQHPNTITARKNHAGIVAEMQD